MKKKIKALMVVIAGYFALLIGPSCVQEQLPDLYARCPGARDANAIDLNVEFAPYLSDRYATSSDTVDFEDFFMVLDLEAEVLSEASSSWAFGRAYALSCAPIYNFKNISNIAVTLREPFGSLQAGTDISYLFETLEGTRLSDLRVFQNLIPTFGLYLQENPENYSQLSLRIFLFLRDGSQILVDTTSPTLKTN
ncbi:hypothetical protein [uncultured Algoriphagus sp.]|uniref:hypothetical protein n=1 Tax=uncultured Algoriphagus sp. TaxID=417365 RepID=UPI00258AE59F|nr:hypothetical protein [uncultured Algoriphagus sp.]